MAMGGAEAILDHCRILASGRPVPLQTDSQLLEQFMTGGDPGEAAFEALVARHGPMVYGVCCRMLGDPHDVQDAYQATFLILVRKAGSLRDRDLLANWLYGVASRVSAKARAAAARRRIFERLAAERAEQAAATNNRPGDDLRSILDEEIGRLPTKYREPLVLCLMEGVRHEDAAQQLGCPVGTIESRLSRARQRLRDRLTRRGYAPGREGLLTSALLGPLQSPADRRNLVASAGVLAVLLAPDRAAASALSGPTVAMAMQAQGFAAASATAIPAAVIVLAEAAQVPVGLAKVAAVATGLSAGMAKLGVAAAGIAAIGIAVAGAGAFADRQPIPQRPAANQPLAKPDAGAPADVTQQATGADEPQRPTLPRLDAPFRPQGRSPVADGVISPGEYGPAWLVDATDDRNPGRAEGISLQKTKDRDDLSYQVSAAHTEDSLFLAFAVRDQTIDAQPADRLQPFKNDGVEIFLDGDLVPNDFNGGPGNREGFQILSDTLGNQLTTATDIKNVDWKVATARTPGGYVMEFEIPLGLIDTADGPQFSPARTGSMIRFNAAVNDNDESVSSQTHYSVLWSEGATALSPFMHGERTWGIELHLAPDGADAQAPRREGPNN